MFARVSVAVLSGQPDGVLSLAAVEADTLKAVLELAVNTDIVLVSDSKSSYRPAGAGLGVRHEVSGQLSELVPPHRHGRKGVAEGLPCRRSQQPIHTFWKLSLF